MPTPRSSSRTDYEALKEVIRSELAPILQRLDAIEHAQDKTYSREMVDSLLKQEAAERDNLSKDVADLRKLVGEAWQQMAYKLGVIVSLIAVAHQYLHIF
jgi:hypothetical protein